MFDIGMQELIIIFIVALLVFGPKRLPELGKTLGKGIAELKKAMSGVKEQVETEIRAAEQPASLVDNVLKREEEMKDSSDKIKDDENNEEKKES